MTGFSCPVISNPVLTLVRNLIWENAMQYYVYMLTNWKNNVLYIGVTNNLSRRLYEHQNHMVPGFTDRYNVCKLVYYEACGDVRSAIAREKELKAWRREKKNALVEKNNPEWRDLSEDGKQ